ALYSNPFHAIVAALFIAVSCHHLMQGLQTVVEDYVHAPAWRTALLLANSMVCAVLGFAGTFAVLKIAFTA
ncbi:MAG: succinate dehydrogenase, hydrophobic membrane anchor protein, partial [Pseudomonadota bacterium]